MWRQVYLTDFKLQKEKKNAIQNFFILFLSDYIMLHVHQHGGKIQNALNMVTTYYLIFISSIFIEYDSNTL